MSDTTRTVRMPTADLTEKMKTVGKHGDIILAFGGRGGVADVPDWWLKEVAETAQAVVDEVDRWRAEMTSFTAASGPLDNMRQAAELAREARESIRTLLTRDAGLDAKVSNAVADALASVAIGVDALEEAVVDLDALEAIILDLGNDGEEHD